MMRVAPVPGLDAEYFSIAHINITERKLLELEVASLSQHDPLTGLANRRLFNSFLHNEWRRSMREHTPLSLIMLDLDNFKACNDHLGHQMGDGSLQLVGHLLQSFCQRPADLPCRFGGDEFALILGNTDRDAAQRIGEEIRQAINDLDIVVANNIQLSASIGIATYTAEQLLEGKVRCWPRPMRRFIAPRGRVKTVATAPAVEPHCRFCPACAPLMGAHCFDVARC